MRNKERTNLSFSNVYAFAEIDLSNLYITWNTFPLVEYWQREITFWGSNVMTSQKNYVYTSEITVSVGILVGPQPFFS